MASKILHQCVIAAITCSFLQTAAISSDKAEIATQQKLPVEIFAQELKRLAPPAKADSASARDAAAKALRESVLFEQYAPGMILWGQYKGGSYDPAKNHVTEFNSLVYRTMYLSLFTFSGNHSVKKADGYTVLTMDVNFRNDLGDGAYPYPFWHASGKWNAYQKAKHLEFVFNDKDILIAVYRGNVMDESRPAHPRTFDGKWEWQDGHGKEQPFAVLYDYVLSNENPHKKELDGAYRAFALEARKTSCMECHSPDNSSKMDRLSILNLPGQALSHRHQIIDELNENTMPPKDLKKNHPGGIDNPAQRDELKKLAKAFAQIGDKALEFEKGKRAEATQQK
jgi:hypothetical protein